MASEVLFHALDPRRDHALERPDLRKPLGKLVADLGVAGAGETRPGWALQVQLGAPGRPPAIQPEWARVVAGSLAGSASGTPSAGSFCYETLSITTAGLDTPQAMRDLARVKGFGPDATAFPFVVGDDPDEEELPQALVRSGGSCILNSVRPHPHLGFHGAVAALGIGLADRAGKIALHRDVRPRVDTPLCAGCGVCMAVCLFDAIVLRAGRAVIDHELCVGCGECMNVCFMAGISPEEEAGIAPFQVRVAEAAATSRDTLSAGVQKWVFFNFVLAVDRSAGGSRNRRAVATGDVGVLASRDPVALDQATWDLLVAGTGEPLQAWSGFRQDPEALLARGESCGLGQRTYRLRPI